MRLNSHRAKLASENKDDNNDDNDDKRLYNLN